MLVLSRKEGESIRVGEDVEITVVRVSGKRVRIGIAAPRDISVTRPKDPQPPQQKKERAGRAAQQPAAQQPATSGLVELPNGWSETLASTPSQ